MKATPDSDGLQHVGSAQRNTLFLGPTTHRPLLLADAQLLYAECPYLGERYAAEEASHQHGRRHLDVSVWGFRIVLLSLGWIQPHRAGRSYPDDTGSFLGCLVSLAYKILALNGERHRYRFSNSSPLYDFAVAFYGGTPRTH